MSEAVVRDATLDDVPALNAIYNEYIVDSHVSFDTEPWTDEARAAWLTDRQASGFPVLVASDPTQLLGCAWSGPWRDKRAYDASVETTIVLAPGAEGRGLGTKLYSALLHRLSDRGFHTAVAIIALPNDASIRLHHKLGYQDIGTLQDVGFKDGKYHSTLMMQRTL